VVVYRSTDRFRHHVARHGGALAYRAVVDSPACPPDADPQPDGQSGPGDDHGPDNEGDDDGESN
jgi:hypothetical protein